MVTHAQNPSTWKAKQKECHKFKTNLSYIMSSRSACVPEETLSLKNQEQIKMCWLTKLNIPQLYLLNKQEPKH